MFEDTAELEHVIGLLKQYAELARLRLTDAQLETARANSPLHALERELRSALFRSGIAEVHLTGLKAVNHLRDRQISDRHKPLQTACIDALWTVLAAPYPDDWDDARLNRLEVQLLTIHGIYGDINRIPRGGRGKGSLGETQKLLRALLKRYPKSSAKEAWRLLRDNNIVKDAGNGENALILPSGKMLRWDAFEHALTTARNAPGLRTVFKKSAATKRKKPQS